MEDEAVSLDDLIEELFVPWKAKKALAATVAWDEEYKRLLRTWPDDDEDGLAKELGMLSARLGV